MIGSRARRRSLAEALALAAIVALAGPFPAARAEAPISESVEVKGQVGKPMSWSVDALRALAQRDATMTSDRQPARIYRGVLLRDLLIASVPTETGRFDLRRSIVVARATDGYVAVFSWEELFDSPVGAGVLVAIERDGQALDVDEGRVALVSAVDTRAGPRHVRWLVSIDVRRVEP